MRMTSCISARTNMPAPLRGNPLWQRGWPVATCIMYMASVLSCFRSRVRVVAARSARSICSSRPIFTTHRVCIIGSGPAGFYTAHKLLKVVHADLCLSCCELKLCSQSMLPHTVLQLRGAVSVPSPTPSCARRRRWTFWRGCLCRTVSCALGWPRTTPRSRYQEGGVDCVCSTLRRRGRNWLL